MNCEQAQECVEAYISKSLPEKRQEEFIRHVKKCPECFQELETYFIVDVAIKYFNEETADTYDIRNLLQEDLDKRLKKHQNKKGMLLILVVAIILVVAFAITSLGVLTNWIELS